MASAITFPNELSVTPMPFIVLTGLDITYNAVHKSIWDAFSNNRRHDRLHLSFACLEGDHQYPQSKTKRMSYDWYIPKGLLKTGWMKKHLSQVPAVVVVFFELDWDDLAWRERHLACASRVQVVRSSLQGRTTKVAVVLIQKSSPLPPGEDMVAAERAAALCSACDLSAKSLFVLPHTDHLIGYIIRLENAFYELAQTYYHTESRRVKAHKEFLNKTTHQLLFPRHQFKIAFFSEMMQDFELALKHYQQSYNHIHELRLHDSNNLELKVVGGFVNYKICKLSFLKLNVPIDAITQFQRHIDLFKPLCGNRELLFEHSAWLSKQFLIFADLFVEAINNVRLTAAQTQHPGFYYQRAAHFAQIRKNLSFKIGVFVKDQPYPVVDPLHCEKLEYFGQRPWRQSHQRIDLSDTSREKEGVLALKLRELEVDHSRQIIPLLSSAVSQFKKFHCPRLKRYLTIEMGKEYFFAKDFDKAMTLLMRAMLEYREGQWGSILTHLLVLLLDCAYLCVDTNSYFLFSTELLSQFSRLPKSHKNSIQDNMIMIICGNPPRHVFVGQKFDESFNVDEVTTAQNVIEKWNSVLICSQNPCIVENNNLKSFVECKVIFSKSQFTVDSCVKLYVCIYITCPNPIEFQELSLSFNNSSYDKHCIIANSSKCLSEKNTSANDSLFYEPKKLKIHEFEFFVNKEDVSKSLFVQVASLKIINPLNSNGIPLFYKWKFTATQPENLDFCIDKKMFKKSWEKLSSKSSTQIIERKSKLLVDFLHKPPALIDEAFPLKIHLQSNELEGTVAENVHIFVSIKPGSDDNLFQGASLSTNSNFPSCNSSKTAELSCGSLIADEKRELMFFLKASQCGLLQISFQVFYQVCGISVVQTDVEEKTISCSSSSTHELFVEMVSPFTIISHLTSINFQSLSTVKINLPFLVLVTITSDSCWPIKVVSGKLQLADAENFYLLGESANIAADISKGESVTDCLNAVCNSTFVPTGAISFGTYILNWKRIDSELPCPLASSKLKIPPVVISFPCIRVNASVPAFGLLRKPVSIKYFIENQSQESKQLEVTYMSADAFMFSGPRQTNNFLPPLSSLSMVFNVIPLALGFQALPQLKVFTCNLIEGAEGQVIQKDFEIDTSSLPSHLTVKPAEILVQPS